MISASSFFPCPSPCFPADHREQATPSPSKCTKTQRQNAFHHIMDRLEQLCCCFLPPGTGEGESTKHASGLDSPGGISIDMGQPSATRDIYCTPRCRTKHCILLTMPRLQTSACPFPLASTALLLTARTHQDMKESK